MEHTDKQYEEDLRRLKADILSMGAIVEEMIADSIKAVEKAQPDLAREVIRRESEVNQLEKQIDDRCIKMIALRQPAASDLRFLIIGLKISTDLERIGDLAVNVAERVLDPTNIPHIKLAPYLPTMAVEVQKMVKNALDAFVQQNVGLAQQICQADDRVDDLNKDGFRHILAVMQQDLTQVANGMSLVSVSKSLERIADHATNIAEEVIYLVQGRDVRHIHRDENV